MRRGKGTLARREQRLAYGLLLPTFLLVFSIVMLPLTANFWISVKPITLADLRPPTLIVKEQLRGNIEQAGDSVKAAEFYRQSVLEVTEGIVSARVGLDWLPESLMMAGDAYEKLELNEAAKNVYKQVKIFYDGTKWAAESEKRLANLPAT